MINSWDIFGKINANSKQWLTWSNMSLVKLPGRHATEAFQIRSPKKMKLNIEYKATGHIAKPKKMG